MKIVVFAVISLATVKKLLPDIVGGALVIVIVLVESFTWYPPKLAVIFKVYSLDAPGTKTNACLVFILKFGVSYMY